MRFSSKNGYTLVEILVVLILLAVAGALVYVNVGRSIGANEEKAFARDMIRLCKKARRMAVDGGVPMAVNISSSQRRCWVDGQTNGLEVPARMRIKGEGIARLDGDVYMIYFYPDGSSDGGELTLTIGDRTVYAFRMDRLTGLPFEKEEEA